MNLYAISRAGITRVNPDQVIKFFKSDGCENIEGTLTPKFKEPIELLSQIQSLSNGELAHVDALNRSSLYKNFYLTVDASSVSRKDGSGGDLIEWDGKRWLVDEVIEECPGWAKVRGVMQVD